MHTHPSTRRHVLLSSLVALVAISLVPGPPPSQASGHASGPDRTGDQVGGIAARLHDADGQPIPGEVFLLIGSGTSPAPARVYEATPYVHERGVHPDTIASNRIANHTVNTLIDDPVELVEMTNSAAGGPSGGVTRAIAYLDIVSDGAFTGDLRVAATGRLRPGGHLGAIEGIDSKVVAADLADVDVLFTPTLPSVETSSAHGARVVGELARDAAASGVLNDPHRVGRFREWGADRPSGVDIVDVRHLIDVSSYLCGAGSDFACEITERLDRQAEQRFDALTDEARSETDRFHAIAPGR